MEEKLCEVPDSQIGRLLEQKLNNVEAEDLPDLFHEKAKLTLETTKKEGKNDIVAELKKAKDKFKGDFAIHKFIGVEVNENSKIYSGTATWGTQKFMITTCLEPEEAFNLVVTNLILAAYK